MSNILPPRAYASDEERRLAEMLVAGFTSIITKSDAAIRLRTSGNEAQRLRRTAVRNMEDAARNIMDAFAFAHPPENPKE